MAKKPAPPSLEAALAAVPAPKKAAKVDLSALPPLLRADGQPLGPDLTAAVLRAAMSEDALLEQELGVVLRAALARESADAFAAAVFEMWRAKEFHGRHKWMGAIVDALGGDRVALSLAPLVVGWSESGETGKERAKNALATLRRIGTDTAIMVLVNIRFNVVKPSVIEAATGTLHLAKVDRGVSLSELLDRITPTLGLDARGTRALSYGERSFTLALDAHFEPSLRDEEGQVVAELPPPGAGDDPTRVEEAKVTYAVLSGQLREAVKVQSYRLEQDMIDGRRWDEATWTRALKEHPLLVSFTRRLLWGVYDKKEQLVAGFRTAEDQTLVDLNDEAFTLPKGARIGVVHPLHLDEAARLRWAQHFADYEIISPFPQLERALMRPADGEREQKSDTRFAGDRFKSGVIRDTLIHRGWERDPSHRRMFYRRDFPGVAAVAHLDPGVYAGAATYDVKDQTIPRVEFKKKGEKRTSSAAMTLGEVPPVAFSEALLDIQEILVDQDA